MYYLSLGSNQGDRRLNLKKAILELSHHGEIIKVSSVYETPSWGYSGSKYYNICLSIILNNDQYNPEEFLNLIHDIEHKLGRERTDIQYTDRLIDIDILIHGNMVYKSSSLTIPHLKLHERKFVLIPLSEINPKLVHPVLKKTVEKLVVFNNDNSKIKCYGKL